MGTADLSDCQEVLVLLTVGRQTTVDQLAHMLRRDCGHVASLLARLRHDLEIRQVGASHHVTDHGRSILLPVLAQWRTDPQPPILMVTHRFDALNDSFKRLLVQRLTFGQTHRDDLHLLNGKLDACGDLLTTIEPWGRRFEGYGDRLEKAFDRYLAGDERFLADPAVDSLHLAWWELHEDLVVTTGIARREDA